MAAGPNITLRRILSQPKTIISRKTKSNKNTTPARSNYLAT